MDCFPFKNNICKIKSMKKDYRYSLFLSQWLRFFYSFTWFLLVQHYLAVFKKKWMIILVWLTIFLYTYIFLNFANKNCQQRKMFSYFTSNEAGGTYVFPRLILREFLDRKYVMLHNPFAIGQWKSHKNRFNCSADYPERKKARQNF